MNSVQLVFGAEARAAVWWWVVVFAVCTSRNGAPHLLHAEGERVYAEAAPKELACAKGRALLLLGQAHRGGVFLLRPLSPEQNRAVATLHPPSHPLSSSLLIHTQFQVGFSGRLCRDLHTPRLRAHLAIFLRLPGAPRGPQEVACAPGVHPGPRALSSALWEWNLAGGQR